MIVGDDVADPEPAAGPEHAVHVVEHGLELVDKTIHVDAPAELLYELLTDAGHFVRWMSATAEIDPRPGGVIRWTLANGDSCAGQFVELVPGRRIVFTDGRERPDVDVPPGSTTVEITLEPQAAGTRLRLVHRGLPGPMADAHSGGWDHYLGRLAVAAHGQDPGPDPSPIGASQPRPIWARHERDERW